MTMFWFAGTPELVRAGSEHGKRDIEHVLGQQPVHAAGELPLPHGRLRRAPLQPPVGPRPRKVPAPPHAPNARGRRRQQLQLCVPGGGRGEQGGRVAVERADERGTWRSESAHHLPGAPGAPTLGEDKVLVKPNWEEGAEDEDRVLHAELQARLRALLHPHRREGCAGPHAEESGAGRLAHGTF